MASVPTVLPTDEGFLSLFIRVYLWFPLLAFIREDPCRFVEIRVLSSRKGSYSQILAEPRMYIRGFSTSHEH